MVHRLGPTNRIVHARARRRESTGDERCQCAAAAVHRRNRKPWSVELDNVVVDGENVDRVRASEVTPLYENGARPHFF